jgi:hypothetical protein
MSKKIKVVLSGIYFPVAILRYFENALNRRDDVDLATVGPYSGTFIPWDGGMNLPPKYAKRPDKALPLQWASNRGGYIVPKDYYGRVDLWIQCDAGWWVKGRPPADVVAHIATDPHVLNYDQQRGNCDFFFNMQKVYSQPGDIYLPYAADPEWHAPMQVKKEWDACLIGLQYAERTKWVEALRAKGLKVYYDNGPAFREYQLQYAKSRVALSWSSKQDLIARVFEGMCMGLPVVTNRVPDINEHFMEGKHLSAFDTLDQAIPAVEHLLMDATYADRIAQESHDLVMEKHLYDHRVQQILETVGLV